MKQKIMRSVICALTMVTILITSIPTASAAGGVDIFQLFDIIFGVGTAAVDVINSTYTAKAEISAYESMRKYYDTMTAKERATGSGGTYKSGTTNNYSIVNNDNRSFSYTYNTTNITKNYIDMSYSPFHRHWDDVHFHFFCFFYSNFHYGW